MTAHFYSFPNALDTPNNQSFDQVCFMCQPRGNRDEACIYVLVFWTNIYSLFLIYDIIFIHHHGFILRFHKCSYHNTSSKCRTFIASRHLYLCLRWEGWQPQGRAAQWSPLSSTSMDKARPVRTPTRVTTRGFHN